MGAANVEPLELHAKHAASPAMVEHKQPNIETALRRRMKDEHAATPAARPAKPETRQL
jgi:hypothetical protein